MQLPECHRERPGQGLPRQRLYRRVESPWGVSGFAPNTICLTDAQLQDELTAMVSEMGLIGRTQPSAHAGARAADTARGGNVPRWQHRLVVLGALRPEESRSEPPPGQFCSYHSQIQVDGHMYAYVVQPWTAHTQCDDPNVPDLPANATAQELAIDAGKRLVSPLSQGQIAAITNPWLNGWFGFGGSEINDNQAAGRSSRATRRLSAPVPRTRTSSNRSSTTPACSSVIRMRRPAPPGSRCADVRRPKSDRSGQRGRI